MAAFETFFNISHDIFSVLDRRGHYKYVNPALSKLLDYPEAEIINHSFTDFLHPEDIELTKREYENAIEGRRNNVIENRFRDRDGTYHWISWSTIVADDAGNFYSSGQDISLQKQLQQEHKKVQEETNKEFQFVTDFMPQMIWVTRPDGFHYYYNKQWYDYTGLSFMETEGEGWNRVFHPDDQQRAWKVWRHSLETGEPYKIEYRCRRFDGAYRWFLGRALPLRDDSGAIIKWFGTCTDIDEQKRASETLEQKVDERTRELRQVNEQLKHFTYSASHDLQEPLRKISFFLNRLLQNLESELSEENRDNAKRIEHTTERMRELIDDLLSYSNATVGANVSREVDLNETVQCVVEDMEVTINETGGEIYYKQLPIIKGDHVQLRQLFQNLFSNALKFHKPHEKPIVLISASLVQGSKIEADIPSEFNNQAYHMIQVKDNGIGFEPQYAERIFKLFQRLHGKAEFEGTGVGLAIVQKVVENHHGYIWAESSLGNGAIFKILLPAE